MAHELFELDIQAGIEMAWHKKTKVVPVVSREIALPYEIERKPIFVNTGKLRKVPDFSVFVSSDNGEIVGKPMAESYQALTNAEFWNVCQDALSGTGAIVESAGTLNNRARRFLTIKLDDTSTKIGGREFKNRISLIDAIDGTAYFHAVNTSICVVCANTAAAAIGDMKGEFRFKLKHTKNFHAKIEGMEKQIESMLGVQAQFNAALEMAANEPLAITGARNLFAGWLGAEAESLSTRAVNTAERLVTLHVKGAGNNGETLLDGVSAVTDFYSHESSGAEEKEGFRWKQFNSSEFGAGARAKTDFLSALFLTEKGKLTGLNRLAINEMQIRGQRLLADYAAAAN
jgi:phage/plasmid-like protein (TIGR03299 family)